MQQNTLAQSDLNKNKNFKIARKLEHVDKKNFKFEISVKDQSKISQNILCNIK